MSTASTAEQLVQVLRQAGVERARRLTEGEPG
jgi:hypothetical protein